MKWLLAWIRRHNAGRSPAAKRASYGLLAGVVGAVSNLFLFTIKLAIGLFAGSISIITDAINNLSDMLSSAVTVIGFKVAAKKPDRSHPFGHERSETIAGFFIAIVMAFVGLQFIQSSFEKIMQPAPLRFSPWVLLILGLSVLLKLGQVLFYQRLGHEIHSQTLAITAKDSLNDIYTTIAVLISIWVQKLSGWQLDGYVGLGVALYILISAIHLMRGFIDDLLGEQPPADLIAKMTQKLDRYDTILGYHDLLVHRYGPNSIFASVHIELDSEWSLNQAHQVIDRIEHDFWHQLGIHLVCHLDPIDIGSQQTAQLYEVVQDVIAHYQLGLKTHDFHIEKLVNDDYLIQFDVVVPEHVKISDDELLVAINHDLRKQLGHVTAEITFDHNYMIKNRTLI